MGEEHQKSKYDETADFYVYTISDLYITPVILGKITADINSTEDQVLQQWREKQPEILRRLYQLSRCRVSVNTLSG